MSIASIQSGQQEAGPRNRGRAPRVPAGFRAMVGALERTWTFGSLSVAAPGGFARKINGPKPGPAAEIEIKDWRMFRRVVASGDLGFADAYMAGECETADLVAFLTAFSANFDEVARVLGGNPLMRIGTALGHAFHRNSRAGSRRNIRAHYDLGEDFYRLWLDPSMTYSAALFTRPGLSLEAAQREKFAALARAIDLRPGQRLLEIGCGWGGFASFAAREVGAQVTAITISKAQHAFASQRIQAEGLGERVEVRLVDYRDVEGEFDRIASIEMLEAVGEAYWPAYFDKLGALMTPGGRAGLQVITIRDDLFDDYRRRPDFIQMHIFPGGMLPSEARLHRETARAGLTWVGERRFGEDYAETLAQWSRRYHAVGPQVAALGFSPRFDRMWRYYLAYCEAGFRTGRTEVLHLTLGKG